MSKFLNQQGVTPVVFLIMFVSIGVLSTTAYFAKDKILSAFNPNLKEKNLAATPSTPPKIPNFTFKPSSKPTIIPTQKPSPTEKSLSVIDRIKMRTPMPTNVTAAITNSFSTPQPTSVKTCSTSLIDQNTLIAANETGVSLYLSPANTVIKKGSDFSVDLFIDTKSYSIEGIDALISYDTNVLKFISYTESTVLQANKPTPAQVQPNYLNNPYPGIVTISEATGPNKTGNLKIAALNFKVLETTQASTTEIKFDFDPNDPNKTTDSNTVEVSTVQDRLRSVINGFYTICN